MSMMSKADGRMNTQQNQRRQLLVGGSIFLLCAHQPIWALSLTQLTQGDAATGLKAILEQSADVVVKQLGVAGGFAQNQRIRIGLPKHLEEAGKALRWLGVSKQLDQLEKGMNVAAEQAVAISKPILTKAITGMTFRDAKAIVSGGDTAGTAYLERSSREALFANFKPIVQRVMNQSSMVSQYNHLVAKMPALGLSAKDFSVDAYVTNKALDGMFLIMGEKESYIRNNPAEAVSGMAQKVLDVLTK